jgi:SAM-dependent MidA family methyltransferase
MSEATAAAIETAIAERGPLDFAAFMELALYGPDGYYQRPPIGAQGDFVTAPHVHPVFGALLARAIRDLWEGLDGPVPLSIAEVGAGDGTLARQLLDGLDDLHVKYLAVERSAGARLTLAEVPGIRVAASLPRDQRPHLILGHELLDNLPFRRVRGTVGGPVEILVGDGLAEVEVPAPADLDAPEDLMAGEERVVPVEALAFVDRIAPQLDRAYALFIDYGADDGPGGDPHGYRGQRVIEDVLADPGSADITAGVDFGAIARRAAGHGLTAFPTISQHDVLMRLGFDAWIRGEQQAQGELLASGRGIEAVRRWADRSRATILADPAHLGRLRWLLLASADLAAPSWLRPTTPPPRVAPV